MENNTSEAIEQLQVLCRNMLKRMNIEGTISARIEFEEDDASEVVIVSIQSPDANMLIGHGGASMSAFQYIARMLYRKQGDEHIHFLVDVNGYREERKELLKQLALSSAHRAVSSGEDVALRPMSSFERRIIHQILGKHDNVETVSVGNAPGRRVVIKPIK